MESKMELLKIEFIQLLKGKKNLLAFSGGVDSSALFFDGFQLKKSWK
jgi:PP-loop superfamily ATP-utilizing enzyme